MRPQVRHRRDKLCLVLTRTLAHSLQQSGRRFHGPQFTAAWGFIENGGRAALYSLRREFNAVLAVAPGMTPASKKQCARFDLAAVESHIRDHDVVRRLDDARQQVP